MANKGCLACETTDVRDLGNGRNFRHSVLFPAGFGVLLGAGCRVLDDGHAPHLAGRIDAWSGAFRLDPQSQIQLEVTPQGCSLLTLPQPVGLRGIESVRDC